MGTTSKNEILGSIRRQLPQSAALPALDEAWTTYPDRPQQFADVLTSVGGRVVRGPDAAALDAQLAGVPEWTSAKKTVSLVPGIGRSTFDLATITDPHDLADVDFAIVPVEFGVAENGAVWVTDALVRPRALFFIVQHLAIVLRADQILSNMHEAYARLSLGSEQFGMFLCGPSKTADIEQSLVIGAHGPRSLTALVIG